MGSLPLLGAGPSGAGVATTYSAAVLSDSPKLYWRAQETSGTTAADASGNSNTGTINATGVTINQATLLSADPTDKAWAFNDTVNANVLSVYTPFPGAVLANRTFEALVKRTASTNNDTVFGITGGGGNDSGLYITAGTSTITWQNGSGSTVTFTGTAAVGSVVHLVYTVTSGGVGEVFVNGTSLGTKSSLNVGAQPFLLGCHGAAGNDPFNGVIDEVAIYESVLSSARISAHNALK